MPRLMTVSNRLPVTLEKRRGEMVFRSSVGGVATGMGSVVGAKDAVWVGWADTSSSVTLAEQQQIAETLREDYASWPVFLTRKQVQGFYQGFSNRTLWPLFHHFTRYVEFEPEFWEQYVSANEAYRDAIIEAHQPGDVIWIHDYQLMLLPGLIREALPDATIGFFLHIPFPSFEAFRMLPWRRELLSGVLGADLVGFHTFDYAHHFLGSVRLLLGIEERFGRLDVDGRAVLVDAFPMGIDVARYRDAARSSAALREAHGARAAAGEAKIILSVDRLDYTKGIPERLLAFDAFLEQHPEWRGRVQMICVAVPSRERVPRYGELKEQVDQLVGRVNGRWGRVDWNPVSYLYRSLPLSRLAGLYASADVALVTPVRDGMNLVAKEFIAANAGGTGVLVLSEMAGAARELSNALIVNPYDQQQVVDTIAEALQMPEAEQSRRLEQMNARLQRYDVHHWANEFLKHLDQAKCIQLALDEHLLTPPQHDKLLAEAAEMDDGVVVLDYDGTLVPFADRPEFAEPDETLIDLLRRLGSSPKATLVLVSGRDRETLEDWFADLEAVLIAEHGAWIREPGAEWMTTSPLDSEWKDDLRPALETASDRTPGSFVEDKEFTLVWHYRNAQPEQAEVRLRELVEALSSRTESRELALLEGNKVLEIKPQGIDKGRAVHKWVARPSATFVLVAGDDRTDESLFETAPEAAWALKVGRGHTRASFTVQSWREMRALLEEIAEVIV